MFQLSSLKKYKIRIYGLDDIFGFPTAFKRCCSHKKLFKRKRTTVIRANCFWLSGFSERQAEREETMTMNDWAAHLDRILNMSVEKFTVNGWKYKPRQSH